MAIREITYYQVTCDYPKHVGDRQIVNVANFHLIRTLEAICKDCWENLMTVEELIDFLGVQHTVTRPADMK